MREERQEPPIEGKGNFIVKAIQGLLHVDMRAKAGPRRTSRSLLEIKKWKFRSDKKVFRFSLFLFYDTPSINLYLIYIYALFK
jgi:hypothetical protein